MTNDDSNDPQEQQQPATKKRYKRGRRVNVQDLRRKLLSTCDRYLEETPLDSLNAAMVKAIGEVLNSVSVEYEKNERTAASSKTLTGFAMPFSAPGVEQPTGVLPLPGTASPANGYPSVPEPTVKGHSGGIKAPPPSRNEDDYLGLRRRE